MIFSNYDMHVEIMITILKIYLIIILVISVSILNPVLKELDIANLLTKLKFAPLKI